MDKCQYDESGNELETPRLWEDPESTPLEDFVNAMRKDPSLVRRQRLTDVIAGWHLNPIDSAGTLVMSRDDAEKIANAIIRAGL